MVSWRDIQKAAPILTAPKRKWYRRWWGVMLIVIVLLLAIYAAVVAVLTYRVYRQIQRGDIPTSGFTEARRDANAVHPEIAPLVVPGAPRFGTEDAKVTIVEFGDFQCPFSREAFSVFRQMMNRYGKKVQFVWRDYPVNDVHPDAALAAEAARCASEQGKFWEYHDLLFLNQSDLSRGALKNYAARAGLDLQKFDECLDSRRYQKTIEDEIGAAIHNKVRGTPTFFLNGYQVSGVIPADLFSKVIERLLSDAK